MSTSISTVIDQLYTIATGLFASKNIIPNAYALENNPITLMRDSYGFRFDEISLSSIDWTITTNVSYSVGFILSREIAKIEGDESKIRTVIKNLFEDELTFRKRMLQTDQLTIGNDIQKITWNNTEGVQSTESNKILYIQSNYLIDIAELIENC